MAEAVGFEPTCPCGQLHFECSSLQPLRYASMYKYSLLGTNHMISSAAPSTTRTTLRVYFRPVFFPEICSKIRWRENRRDGKKYSILRFSVLRNIKENQGDEIPSFRRNFESCSHLAFPCLLWSVTAALETAKALVLQRILDAPTGIDQLHIRKNLSSN